MEMPLPFNDNIHECCVIMGYDFCTCTLCKLFPRLQVGTKKNSVRFIQVVNGQVKLDLLYVPSCMNMRVTFQVSPCKLKRTMTASLCRG
ncbi:hypothetical protein F2P81_019158 [Scophthalmus maximus]|uniref:Uncharacterized protein n=1 Tax=Scophthalmus maximus TaxID=52904 RepID=A0A6A4SAE7_SCOMX|nr:hypothetical protein F2P81_019158 [Scophthalmus maximus]